VPSGFRVFSIARKPSVTFSHPWGGVLAIVHNTLNVTLRNDLSGPDILVLDFQAFLLFNVYLLPDSSPWESWADVHPLDHSMTSLALAHGAMVPVILMGDFNGRIGEHLRFTILHVARLILR
jgi:hypothetical protein